MSIDERLRPGLAANTATLTTETLTSVVSEELDALGHRVRRRRRARIAGYAVAAAVVIGAAAFFVPPTVQSLREPTLPGDRTSEPSPAPEPIAMSDLPQNSAVAPGRYAGEFTVTPHPELPRAVVTVPPGYLAGGAGGVYHEAGGWRELSLWTVYQVANGACTDSVEYVDLGPTARDLADALVALPVWKSSTPEPVTVGGYDGLVMDFDVPDPMPASCGNAPEHWVDDVGGSQSVGPGKRQRLWILDVEGQRVVLMAGWFPGGVSDVSSGVTPAEASELIEMAESITFLGPPAASP